MFVYKKYMFSKYFDTFGGNTLLTKNERMMVSGMGEQQSVGWAEP